jgi:hypothetical protein
MVAHAIKKFFPFREPELNHKKKTTSFRALLETNVLGVFCGISVSIYEDTMNI